MVVVTTVKDLQALLKEVRKERRTIGLVPTMGALHNGHLSLVTRCVKENDVTVVSVFVNPTQFNNKADLQNYPRTPEADCQLLKSTGTDIVFIPTVEEIYPEPDHRCFSYPPIDTVMEGGRRPGHFNGVCQIVSKLFYIVTPNRAYFGEKDFQQIAVIRAMIADLKIPVQICPCPIVREANGLAMSSRNTLLSEAEKNLASHISQTLFKSQTYIETQSVSQIHDYVVQTLNSLDNLKVEYFEIVNGFTLQPIFNWNETNYIVGCIAVYCGQLSVRLIDNIKFKELA